MGEGVSTRSLTDLVKVLPAAKFVLIHAEKGFTTNLSVSDFFEPDVLFALKHNGNSSLRDTASPCGSWFRASTSGRVPSG